MSDKKKDSEITIRSSAAEYLAFVAATGYTPDSVEMRYQDENIWLAKKKMAALYDASVAAVNQHIKRIYADGELEPGATIKKYLTVQTEGARQVEREIEHCNLPASFSASSFCHIAIGGDFLGSSRDCETPRKYFSASRNIPISDSWSR